MRVDGFEIGNFKRIKKTDLALSEVTVLIGGNNCGKSSILQGMHFAITSLQSAKSANLSSTPASTLSSDQLIYKPASDPMLLNCGGAMSTSVGPEFTFTFSDGRGGAPSNFSVKMARGKNANISLRFDSDSLFYERASDRTRPLSIFVPGLAGVALREERRSDAIVTAGIAQGDANLYLRNVLLRLIHDPVKLDRFHTIISEVFNSLRLRTEFDEKIHQHIGIIVESRNAQVPLEMVGTGTLQAIQLVAYATMYDPALLLLDEPDAHLHPSNQRLLAATLLKIAEQGNTKVVLATHSRHIFDSLTRSPLTTTVWLKDGKRQAASNSQDLSILLDLGALDSYELVASDAPRVVVLTEDTKAERLKILLEYNGFKPNEYIIQQFNGVSNILMSAAIAEFFARQGSNTFVLVHRDRDCLLDDELQWCLRRDVGTLPERCEVFFTPLNDIEHSFCQPEHVASALGIDLEQAEQMVSSIIDANQAGLAIEFANKRNDLKSKYLRNKTGVPSAADLAPSRVSFEQCRGKSLWGFLHQAATAAHFNANKLQTTLSPALEIRQLKEFAARVWIPPNPSNVEIATGYGVSG